VSQRDDSRVSRTGKRSFGNVDNSPVELLGFSQFPVSVSEYGKL